MTERKALAVGVVTGSVLTVLATGVYFYFIKPRKAPEGQTQQADIVDGVDGLIGNTPLMKIKSLSEATGCLVLVRTNSECSMVPLLK
jgi:cysteine synthase A